MGPNLLSAQYSAHSVLWMWMGCRCRKLNSAPPSALCFLYSVGCRDVQLSDAARKDRRDFTTSLQTLEGELLLLIISIMWFWLFLDGTDFFTSGRSRFQSVCETVLEHTNESHPALCSAHLQNWILTFFFCSCKPCMNSVLYTSHQHYILVWYHVQTTCIWVDFHDRGRRRGW